MKIYSYTTRLIIAIVTILVNSAASIAQPLSDTEIQVLRDGALHWDKDSGKSDERRDATKLAQSLGENNRKEAIVVLIEIGNPWLLRIFANKYQAVTTPDIEVLIQEHLSDPIMGDPVSHLINQHSSRPLFEQLKKLIIENKDVPDCGSYVRAILSTTLTDIEEELSIILSQLDDKYSQCTSTKITEYLAIRQYTDAEDIILDTFWRHPHKALDIAPAILKLGTKNSFATICQYLISMSETPQDQYTNENIRSLLSIILHAPPTQRIDMKYFSEENMSRFSDTNKHAINQMLAMRMDRERMAIEITPRSLFFWIGSLEHNDLVQYFLANGVDVNAAHDGQTALHVAAASGNWAAMRLLLEHGADPNAKGHYNKTAMHIIAARYIPMLPDFPEEQMNIARLLVANGGDVAARSHDDYTPLHHAAAAGNIKLIEFLIQNGADVNAKTTNGITPVDSAISSDKQDAAQALLANGGKISMKIETNHDELIRAILAPYHKEE